MEAIDQHIINNTNPQNNMKPKDNPTTRPGGTDAARPIIFTVQSKAAKKPQSLIGRILKRGKDEESRTFTIHPPTLGKLQILSGYLNQLGLDDEALKENPYTEVVRACSEKAAIVYELMAAAVCNTREELTDEAHRRELADFFKWNGDAKDFGALVLAVLVQNDYAKYAASVRLTKSFRMNRPAPEEEAGDDVKPNEPKAER